MSCGISDIGQSCADDPNDKVTSHYTSESEYEKCVVLCVLLCVILCMT